MAEQKTDGIDVFGSRHDVRASGLFCSWRRARFLVDSDYGRRAGWYVEFDGQVVGELSDPRFEDHFWYSYAASEPKGDYRTTSLMGNDTLWDACRFSFRNRVTGEVAPRAFAGGVRPFVRDGRVLMRGLCLEPSSRTEARFVRLLFFRRRVTAALSS
jgi:hypothetical protein